MVGCLYTLSGHFYLSSSTGVTHEREGGREGGTDGGREGGREGERVKTVRGNESGIEIERGRGEGRERAMYREEIERVRREGGTEGGR
jgi:hypothetical protein